MELEKGFAEWGAPGVEGKGKSCFPGAWGVWERDGRREVSGRPPKRLADVRVITRHERGK